MWHVNDEGAESGPYDSDELRSRFTQGQISPRAVVWREGMDGWKPIRSVLKPRHPTQGTSVPADSPPFRPAPVESEEPAKLPPLVIAAYVLGLGSFCCSLLSGVPGIICAVIATMNPKTQKQGQIALIVAVICTIAGSVVNVVIGSLLGLGQ